MTLGRPSNPYPTYKPSGFEWLRDVPAHWDVRQLRNILAGINERNRPDLPLLSVVRERGVILRNVTDLEENHNFIPDDLTNALQGSQRWAVCHEQNEGMARVLRRFTI